MMQLEVEEKIIEYYNRIEDWLIYFPLKQLKLKHIYPPTINTVKYCIVLDYMGLPINSTIVTYFQHGELRKNSIQSAITNRLHMLASKRILRLDGYGKSNILIFSLHLDFIELLKIGFLDEIIEWREEYIFKHNKQISKGENG